MQTLPITKYLNLAMALFAAPSYMDPPKAEQILKRVGTELDCSHNYDFDYGRLSLLWPPGYCLTSEEPCKQELIKNDFIIESMIPVALDGNNPIYCCVDRQFDADKVSKYQWDDIESSWRSLHSPWKEAQVQNEWKVHGTCARAMNDYIRGQQSYVGKTLQHFEDLDLLNYLKMSNLISGTSKIETVNGSKLQQSLRELAQGKLPLIGCQDWSNDETGERRPILTGLSFCYDKKHQNIDCEPRQTKESCLGELLIINKL